MKPVKSVDEYIADTPKELQGKLKELREVIKSAAPNAQEKISYRMPGYNLKGPLVYFAAYKNHIGLYPTSSNLEESIKEVSRYRTGKGTLQFPLDQPLPLALIRKIVEFRVVENLDKNN